MASRCTERARTFFRPGSLDFKPRFQAEEGQAGLSVRGCRGCADDGGLRTRCPLVVTSGSRVVLLVNCGFDRHAGRGRSGEHCLAESAEAFYFDGPLRKPVWCSELKVGRGRQSTVKRPIESRGAEPHSARVPGAGPAAQQLQYRRHSHRKHVRRVRHPRYRPRVGVPGPSTHSHGARGGRSDGKLGLSDRPVRRTSPPEHLLPLTKCA